MKPDRPAASKQQRSVWTQGRHARRLWKLGSGHSASAPVLSLGTLQALMGLAAYQARTR